MRYDPEYDEETHSICWDWDDQYGEEKSNLQRQLDMGIPALTDEQKVETLEKLGLNEDGESAFDSLEVSSEGISITVEVPESASSDQKEMYHQLAQIYKESLQLVIDKNQSYGNAFLQTDSSSPFDDPVTEVLYRLHLRADDKDNRFTEQAFGDGGHGDSFDEDTDETTVDNIGYWSWLTWVLRHYRTDGDSE